MYFIDLDIARLYITSSMAVHFYSIYMTAFVLEITAYIRLGTVSTGVNVFCFIQVHLVAAGAG